MKRHRLLASFASLLGIGFSFSAHAQSYTDPVGAIAVTAKSGSDTGLSVPFNRSPVFVGAIKEIAGGNTITVHGSPSWSLDEFATVGHFAMLGSGVKEGAYFTILTNTTDSLTLELVETDLTGVSADLNDPSLGDSIQIFPYWTPATLLPSDLPQGAQIFLYDLATTINKSPATVLNYNGTDWIRGFSFANDFLLHPYESFVLRLPESTDVEIVFAGAVPMNQHRVVFNNDNGSGTGVQTDFRTTFMSPIPATVNEMDIGFSTGDQLLIFDNSQVGINKSPSTILNFNGTDWIRGFSLANDFVIEPGQSLVFRRASSGSTEVIWSSLPSYLQ